MSMPIDLSFLRRSASQATAMAIIARESGVRLAHRERADAYRKRAEALERAQQPQTAANDGVIGG